MSGHTQQQQGYEFEDFRLDLSRRVLLRDGAPVHLTPKAFDTLLALVRRRGLVAEKDELLREVWPDTFVEEATLTQNISTLRKALGQERGNSHQYIETVPRHGYRFAARVRELGGEDSAQAPPAEEITRPPITAEEADEAGPSEPLAGVPVPTPAAVKRRPRAALLVLLIPLFGLAALSLWKFPGRTARPGGTDESFRQMRLVKLTGSGDVTRAALSPDGSYVAYAAADGTQQGLRLRQVSAPGSVQVVAPAEVEYLGINFAPEGNYIYYTTREKGSSVGVLHRVPTLGGTPQKILEDVDGEITFAPDARQFAFVRHAPDEGASTLLVANADGTDTRPVLSRRRPDILRAGGIAWAPDGQAIASVTRVGGNNNPRMVLTSVRLADRQEQPLTDDRWEWIGQAAWLPDGSGLLFDALEARASTFSAQLWPISYPEGRVTKVTNDLHNYEGVSLARSGGALATVVSSRVASFWNVPVGAPGQATRISSGAGEQFGEQTGMTWTPHNKIVFGSTAGGNLDIWLMNADGGDARQLTSDPQLDLKPAVSSDGRFVVFVSWRTGAPHLWQMNIDGSDPQQLTDGAAETMPDISPDGRFVVYTSVSEGRPTLWRMPFGGGAATQLTERFSLHPSVSPDNRLIAFFYREPPDPSIKLAVIQMDGGAPVKTFDVPAGTFVPAKVRWTRDGRALTYVVTRGRVSNIWSQPLAGGAARELTSFQSDEIFRFDWSPDGKHLALERGLAVSDIVLISNVRAD